MEADKLILTKALQHSTFILNPELQNYYQHFQIFKVKTEVKTSFFFL